MRRVRKKLSLWAGDPIKGFLSPSFEACDSGSCLRQDIGLIQHGMSYEPNNNHSAAMLTFYQSVSTKCVACLPRLSPAFIIPDNSVNV